MLPLRHLATIALLLCLSVNSFSQQGIPLLTNFEVPPTMSTRSWAISQDHNGLMYFLNRKGIFTFDGYSWVRLSIPGRPLAMHYHNNLYFSTANRIGYATRNDKGDYNIHFLNDTLQDFFHSFLIHKNNLYVLGSQNLARINKTDDILEVILHEPDSSQFISHTFTIGESIYIVQGGVNLLRIDSAGVEKKPLKLNTNEEIRFTFPFKDKVLIGTSHNQLISFDGETTSRVSLKDQKYLDASRLVDGLAIDTARIALATQLGGCMIVNVRTLETESYLNIVNGLPDDEIFALTNDNLGGLWLSHAMGITRVGIDLPIKSFHHLSGLNGNIHSVALHNENLYVGTTEGVFVLVEEKDYKAIEVTVRQPQREQRPTPAPTPPEPKEQEEQRRRGFFGRLFDRADRTDRDESSGAFRSQRRDDTDKTAAEGKKIQPVKRMIYSLQSITHRYNKIEGIDGRCWQLVDLNGKLIAITSTGVYRIIDNKAEPVIRGVYALFAKPSSFHEEVFFICSYDGVWSVNTKPSPWNVQRILTVRNELPLSIEEENHEVFYITTELGVYKVNYTQSGYAGSTPLHSNFEGIENPIVRRVNDTLRLFTSNSIYTIDPTGDSLLLQRTIPDGRLLEIIISQKGISWLHERDSWTALMENYDAPTPYLPYLSLFDDIIYIHKAKDDNYYIVDGFQGIYRISPPDSTDTEHGVSIFPSHIVDINGNRVSIDGITLSYSNNGLKVTLTAPFFLKEGAVEFRHYIDGVMGQWSEWSSSPIREFPYLPNGRFTLNFQARDLFGNESEVYQIPLRIHPPFWKTFWFISICIVIGLILIFILIRFREQQLIREKRILEQRVKKRTRTIEEQRDILMRQRDELTQRNQEIIQQKEEIETQRDEIEGQRNKIYKQNEDITKSIEYAKRIQTAVMPTNEVIRTHLPEHFLFFRPRDIVSGDFYWINQKDDKVVVVVADCTGHGVPGAFMSMLGVSFLNEIVGVTRTIEPHEILNKLRNLIKLTLSQTGKEGENRDGMDVAVCVIDFKKKHLQFSGAYNPMYLIRKGELIEVKPDKMPVGIHLNEKESFTNNTMEIFKGDQVYLFSDGFIDQFGGDDGKKFMSRYFKNLLVEISELPMDKQKDKLEQTYDSWKREYPQVDDTIVIGIRV